MTGKGHRVFEWDIVEDSEMWGHVCNLALGEQAQISWFFDLLCFEAAGVVCQKWLAPASTALLRTLHCVITRAGTITSTSL
jgi:hypothetical protein